MSVGLSEVSDEITELKKSSTLALYGIDPIQ